MLLLTGAAPDLVGLGFEQHLGATIPADLTITDADGHADTVSKLLEHHPTLLILGYFSCPMLCGVTRDDTIEALGRSGLHADTDYRMLFVSIDPAERSTDAAMAKRTDIKRYPVAGAERGWRYATGSPETIARLMEVVGFHSRYDPALKQFLHPAGLVVLTPDAVVSGYLLGVGTQPGAIVAALSRARTGAIGQQAPAILLLCFHYDPSTGRYTFEIMRLLRLMGFVTLLLIAGFVVLLRWRTIR